MDALAPSVDEVSQPGAEHPNAIECVLEACGECGLGASVCPRKEYPRGDGHRERNRVPHRNVEPRKRQYIEREDELS